MRDLRRRGNEGDALDRAAEEAIGRLLARLPPEQHVAALRRLRADLGQVLVHALLPKDRGVVDEVAVRARLAAAFRVKLPEEEGPGRDGAGGASPRPERGDG